MMATTRRPGRPVNVERRIRLMLRDEAEAVAAALVRQARLGDAAACEVVLKLALGLPATQPGGPAT